MRRYHNLVTDAEAARAKKTKKLVARAFRTLRKFIPGLVTGSNLSESAVARIDVGDSAVNPFVFYSKGSSQRGIVYLSYGAGSRGAGVTSAAREVETVKFGRVIAATMRVEGLAVNWNGDTAYTIKVSAPMDNDPVVESPAPPSSIDWSAK